MANLLDRALDVHRSRLQTTGGDLCVYVRARFRITNVRCVTGDSDFVEATNELEGFSEVKTIDFLIDPRDLKIGDDLIEPQRGDQIEFRGELFDVMPGRNQTMWRWSDSRKTYYRIHTDRRRVESN